MFSFRAQKQNNRVCLVFCCFAIMPLTCPLICSAALLQSPFRSPYRPTSSSRDKAQIMAIGTVAGYQAIAIPVDGKTCGFFDGLHVPLRLISVLLNFRRSRFSIPIRSVLLTTIDIHRIRRDFTKLRPRTSPPTPAP